jgi:ribosome-associated translation inhibitor RaiA
MFNETHFSADDAKIKHLEILVNAMKHGKWLAAVWAVKPEGLELVGKTTWDFPFAAFDQAVEKLREVLTEQKERHEKSEREKKAPKEPEPLELGRPFVREGLPTARPGPSVQSEDPKEHPAPPDGMGVSGLLSDESPVVSPRQDGKIRLEPMGEPRDEEVAGKIGPVGGVAGGPEEAGDGGEEGERVREEGPEDSGPAGEEKEATGGDRA